MKFKDLLRLIPEAQKMCLVYLDFQVSGTMEALICVLDERIHELVVTNVEADDGELSVWLEEEDPDA